MDSAMSFEKAEFASRVARAQTVMRECGVDMLIANAGEYMGYLSGYDVSLNLYWALVPASGQPVMVFVNGSGVDHLGMSASDLPVVRMVEPGITAGMTRYVVMSVLAALSSFGFNLRSWSRTPRYIDGVDDFTGVQGLAEFLAGTDILACMLPSTAQTREILDGRLYAMLSRGAVVINVSRGGNVNQADLLTALDSGRLSALLDVTDPEPLPADSRLWRDPRVLIPSHIASRTQPKTAASVVIDNISRHLACDRLMDVVDRARG